MNVGCIANRIARIGRLYVLSFVSFCALACEESLVLSKGEICPTTRREFIFTYLQCEENSIQEYFFYEAILFFWRQKHFILQSTPLDKLESLDMNKELMHRFCHLEVTEILDIAKSANSYFYDRDDKSKEIDNDDCIPVLALSRSNAMEAIAPGKRLSGCKKEDFVVDCVNLHDYELKYITYVFRKMIDFCNKAAVVTVITDDSIFCQTNLHTNILSCCNKSISQDELATHFMGIATNSIEEIIFLYSTVAYRCIEQRVLEASRGGKVDDAKVKSIIDEDKSFIQIAFSIVALEGNRRFADESHCPKEIRTAICQDYLDKIRKLRLYAWQALSSVKTMTIRCRSDIAKAILNLRESEPKHILYIEQAISNYYTKELIRLHDEVTSSPCQPANNYKQ